MATTALEITTEFADFEAFWQPFTLGAGPAPDCWRSLDDTRRDELKAALAEEVGGTGGRAGRVALPARAWAVRDSAG